MDSGHWISRLATTKRFYEVQLGHADRAGMDELDMDGDENAARPNFACPYCYEDHDIASLVAHLEEDHPFEPHTVVTIGAAVAAVPVGGATAASGGVAAAAPKGNLHQTQPHNRASRSSRLKTFEEARSPSQQLALYVTEFVMLNFLRNLMYC